MLAAPHQWMLAATACSNSLQEHNHSAVASATISLQERLAGPFLATPDTQLDQLDSPRSRANYTAP
jgi:hypothetical protein